MEPWREAGMEAGGHELTVETKADNVRVPLEYDTCCCCSRSRHQVRERKLHPCSSERSSPSFQVLPAPGHTAALLSWPKAAGAEQPGSSTVLESAVRHRRAQPPRLPPEGHSQAAARAYARLLEDTQVSSPTCWFNPSTQY